jgi:large subunit ribosomal protein L17
MRHMRKGRNLSRKSAHRSALLRNMVTSLFRHYRIYSTHAKALELRRVAERLITFGKSGSLADRRQVAKTIADKTIIKKLFEEIAPQYKERNGGYTRVIKVKYRKGDSATISLIELVELVPVAAKEAAETGTTPVSPDEKPAADTTPSKPAKTKAAVKK